MPSPCWAGPSRTPRRDRGPGARSAPASFPPQDYLDLTQTAHRVLFDHTANVWEAIDKIAAYLKFSLRPAVLGELVGKPYIGENVFVGEGTIIEHGAMIKGGESVSTLPWPILNDNPRERQ